MDQSSFRALVLHNLIKFQTSSIFQAHSKLQQNLAVTNENDRKIYIKIENDIVEKVQTYSYLGQVIEN